MITEPEPSTKDQLAPAENGLERQADQSPAGKPEETEAAELASPPEARSAKVPNESQEENSFREVKSQAGDSQAGGSKITDASTESQPDNRLGDALAALDRKDYATARLLFDAVGKKDAAEAIGNALAALDRKDYATAQGLFEAFAPPMPPESPAGMTAASPVVSKAEHPPPPTPFVVAPIVDAASREPPFTTEMPKRRRSMPFPPRAALVLLAVIGVIALYGSRRNRTLDAAKGQAMASLASTGQFMASASDLVTARVAAFVAPRQQSKEDRPSAPDLGAALTQLTARFDRMEQTYGARFDELDKQTSREAAAVATLGVGARLDALEKKSAGPPELRSALADVVARLDKLEKKAATAAVSSSELADITKRLSGLEKRTTVLAAGSNTPLPPHAPKRSTKVAKADPSASTEILTSDSGRPVLRDYSLEGVQDGLAMVDGRYGPLQVGPGDFVPGAGRVLRIERRGGAWLVETSRGVIESDPGAY